MLTSCFKGSARFVEVALVAYMFLWYVRIKAYVFLCDVHVSLKQNTLKQPARVLRDDLLGILKLEDLLQPLRKSDRLRALGCG